MSRNTEFCISCGKKVVQRPDTNSGDCLGGFGHTFLDMHYFKASPFAPKPRKPVPMKRAGYLVHQDDGHFTFASTLVWAKRFQKHNGGTIEPFYVKVKP